jgi:hypothetical protein
VRKGLGFLLVVLALILGGFGIWVMATEDVQGGRHEAGAMILGVAVVAALTAAGVLGFRRGGG